MQNMTQIVVETRPLGFLGILLIVTVMVVFYTIGSLHIQQRRIEKLKQAERLIKEGHQRKVDAEIRQIL